MAAHLPMKFVLFGQQHVVYVKKNYQEFGIKRGGIVCVYQIRIMAFPSPKLTGKRD